MHTDPLLKNAEDSMNKSVEYVVHEFATVRTGKASPSLVEGIDIHVTHYGSTMKLKQLAVISTPEPRLITVQPFDPSTAADIEKGLKESKLGITPSVDGKLIRLPIPELSEERRKDLVKLIKQMAEEARVRIRSGRKDAMDQVKSQQKGGEITEDDLHRLEKEIQHLTDNYVKKVDELLTNKEAEIMTV